MQITFMFIYDCLEFNLHQFKKNPHVLPIAMSIVQHCAPRVHSRAEAPGFSSSQFMTAPGQIGWMDVQIYGHGLDSCTVYMCGMNLLCDQI